MKKSLVIIALLLVCFGVKAMTGGESISYVKAGGNVYFGKDLKVGLFNTRIISTDGTVMKFSNRDVDGYLHNSRLFEFLPVVSDRNDTICYAMMEYVTFRSGFKLYRYRSYDDKEPGYEFFVFKDEKFYFRIDEKNAASALSFFGIHML